MTDLSDVSDRPGGVGFNMSDSCEAWSGCLLDTIAYLSSTLGMLRYHVPGDIFVQRELSGNRKLKSSKFEPVFPAKAIGSCRADSSFGFNVGRLWAGDWEFMIAGLEDRQFLVTP